MTADLRAALREALQMAADALPLFPVSRVREQFARLVVLADAPPAVAELLPLVVNSTREVRWTDTDGDHWRAFAVGGGRPIGFMFRRNGRGDWHDGNPCDLTQPATLVEVAP